ncbi:hypothetical protein J4Q44_G00386440 [Coregonus suidteri]|uniref:Uncharacterized protein n=1 Tax=Coregonus suidteri TaxID=861788 RepID=A0AAN8KL10_9TELE
MLEKYLMAVFIGTIGGVAVIALIIAAVRYVGHNNKKANGNTGQVLVSKLENPALYYSTVRKDKQCLRKKVLKTELLGSKFTSILEESTVRFLNNPTPIPTPVLSGRQHPSLIPDSKMI